MADLTGSYASEDGRTTMAWALPEWSDLDRIACGIGLHIASRKRVVEGWINYFSRVDRWYCACGRKSWVWFEDGFADSYDEEPGGHLRWIEGRIAMDRQFAEHREWERRMSEGHPCWGAPYSCISCGCSKETPCVSHRRVAA